jgi:hypothetical protein
MQESCLFKDLHVTKKTLLVAMYGLATEACVALSQALQTYV